MDQSAFTKKLAKHYHWFFWESICSLWLLLLITARKRSLRRLCFYTCLSVQGGIPACIAGGIPACLAAGLGGVVSQHALQVSRPTPRGEVEGDLARGGLQAHTEGGSWGDLARVGVSRPIPRGGLSQHALRQTPPTATAAGGTHPTGIHSCLWIVPFHPALLLVP